MNQSLFTRFSRKTSYIVGRPATFLLAVLVVLVWAITGPVFGYSDTWQLVINTGTTIVTFLMVFLIQATQNRDAEAAQLKLDEIIRSQQGAHNMFLNLEELEEEDLIEIRKEYVRLAERARRSQRRGNPDTGVPQVNVPAK
jgi:low affinity Fe/Cu permease